MEQLISDDNHQRRNVEKTVYPKVATRVGFQVNTSPFKQTKLSGYPNKKENLDTHFKLKSMVQRISVFLLKFTGCCCEEKSSTNKTMLFILSSIVCAFIFAFQAHGGSKR